MLYLNLDLHDGGRVGYSKGGGLMNLRMGGMPVKWIIELKVDLYQ
jgi:hypothetical protein